MQLGPLQPYETAIRFVSETQFMAQTPEDTDTVTLLAFLYGRDELRVLHDIRTYLKKRDKEE